MTTGELRRMAELWAGAMPVKQIAQKLGYSPSYIRDVAHRNREMFPARHRRRPKAERDQWADRVISGELGVRECARQAGCNPVTVRKWARDRRAQ